MHPTRPWGGRQAFAGVAEGVVCDRAHVARGAGGSAVQGAPKGGVAGSRSREDLAGGEGWPAAERLGQAVRNTLTRWPKRVRYPEDRRFEIDNNQVENAIRPIAVGRNNYLFVGSHNAAQRATVIYTLLGTCKLHGINPQEWLSGMLSRIPTYSTQRISDLLPHRWQGRP